MIFSANRTYNEKKVYLCVSKNPTGYEIQPGDLTDTKSFSPKCTIIIDDKNPNLLWDLLHNYLGIPYPLPNLEIKIPEEKLPEPKSNPFLYPPKEDLNQELELRLKELNAKDIIKKVQDEKNIEIKINLKSKALIIKKALEIYYQENKISEKENKIE